MGSEGNNPDKEWTSRGFLSCDEDKLLSLDGKALADYLVRVPSSCAELLFRKHASSAKLYSGANMRLIADEAAKRIEEWDGSGSGGFAPLAVFLRSAYFVQNNHSSEIAPFGADIDARVLRLVDGLMRNRAMWDTEVAETVQRDFYRRTELTSAVSEVMLLLDSVRDYDAMFRHTTHYFSEYVKNPGKFKKNLVALGMHGMQVAAYRTHKNEGYMRSKVERGEAKPLLDSMVKLVNDGETAFSDPQLYRNMIRESGRYARYGGALGKLAENTVAGVLKTSKRFSPEWAEAVYTLTTIARVDCERYSAQTLCTARDELRRKLLPHRWVLDGGKLVVETPLPFNEIVPLYHALKQVKAKFTTLTGHLAPVDGDANDVLTMVVFGSPDEYRHYQRALHNLNSDNGGLYIEKDATFYTFQRKPHESSLTLEDLMRHEYVHYLAGRYLIKGDFGRGALYGKSTRMAWFDEGVAEFFAGATSRDGVKIRPHTVESTRHDYPRVNWSPEIIMSSSYGADSFSFYHHAALWFNYLHQHDSGKLKTLFEHTRRDDAAGFDRWVEQTGKDARTVVAYQSWVDGLKQDYRSSPWKFDPVPVGGWLAPDQWRLADVRVIEAKLRGQAVDVRCQRLGEGPQSLINRFYCHGVVNKGGHASYEGRVDALNGVHRALAALEGEDNFRAVECSVANAGSSGLRGLLECEGPLTTRQRPVSLQKDQRLTAAAHPVSPFSSRAVGAPGQASRHAGERSVAGGKSGSPDLSSPGSRANTHFTSRSRCVISRLPLHQDEQVTLERAPAKGRVNMSRDGRFSYLLDPEHKQGGDLFVVRGSRPGGESRRLTAYLNTLPVDLPPAECARLGGG